MKQRTLDQVASGAAAAQEMGGWVQMEYFVRVWVAERRSKNGGKCSRAGKMMDIKYVCMYGKNKPGICGHYFSVQVKQATQATQATQDRRLLDKMGGGMCRTLVW